WQHRPGDCPYFRIEVAKNASTDWQWHPAVNLFLMNLITVSRRLLPGSKRDRWRRDRNNIP
ncbi:MAG: hypothetical protein ACE5JA_01535, partial [bacterium]